VGGAPGRVVEPGVGLLLEGHGEREDGLVGANLNVVGLIGRDQPC